MKSKLLLAAAAISLVAAPAHAQTSTRDRITQILGNIFGVGNSADSSLDGQWRAGKRPLAGQQATFNARVDADVRAGVMTSSTGAQLKYDYASVVDLEARYGADGTYSATERSELQSRYNALAQVLNSGTGTNGNGGYVFDPGNPSTAVRAEVRDGQAEFNRRVDAQVTARKLSRTAATRLKSDYAAVVTLETDYLRDGLLSESERSDLDARLDALDVRVGDIAYTAPALSPRQRLDAVLRAIPTSGLSTALQNQLRIEHGDLTRLEAAYARLTLTADERAYLDRRIGELEVRARVKR